MYTNILISCKVLCLGCQLFHLSVTSNEMKYEILIFVYIHYSPLKDTHVKTIYS